MPNPPVLPPAAAASVAPAEEGPRPDTRGHTRKITKEEILEAQAMANAGVTTPIGAGAGPDTSSGIGTGTTGGVSPEELRPSPLPRSPATRIAIGGAVLVAAVGIVLIAVSVGARSVERREAAAAATNANGMAGPLASGDPTPASPASGDTESAPLGSGSAASVDPLSPASKAIDIALVHIDTVPPKASIFVNGAKKGVSPIDLKLAKGTTAVNVEIRQPGFVTVKEKIVPDANQKLRITLSPVPVSSGGAAPYHRFD